jgi:hypothetical protein
MGQSNWLIVGEKKNVELERHPQLIDMKLNNKYPKFIMGVLN